MTVALFVLLVWVGLSAATAALLALFFEGSRRGRRRELAGQQRALEARSAEHRMPLAG